MNKPDDSVQTCSHCLAVHDPEKSCKCHLCATPMHPLFIRCAVIGGKRVALCPTCDDARMPSGSESYTGYVVSGNAELSEGKEYEVRNERKGTFTMLITKIDGEWITGTITEGVAKAMMRYNFRGVGEEVTVRSCHSYFIPVGRPANEKLTERRENNQ